MTSMSHMTIVLFLITVLLSMADNATAGNSSTSSDTESATVNNTVSLAGGISRSVQATSANGPLQKSPSLKTEPPKSYKSPVLTVTYTDTPSNTQNNTSTSSVHLHDYTKWIIAAVLAGSVLILLNFIAAAIVGYIYHRGMDNLKKEETKAATETARYQKSDKPRKNPFDTVQKSAVGLSPPSPPPHAHIPPLPPPQPHIPPESPVKANSGTIVEMEKQIENKEAQVLNADVVDETSGDSEEDTDDRSSETLQLSDQSSSTNTDDLNEL